MSPAGRWLTAHTTHFRIHYRPGADSLAAQAGREGERAYAATGPDGETYGVGGLSGVGYQVLPDIFTGSGRQFRSGASGGRPGVAPRLWPTQNSGSPGPGGEALRGLPYGVDRLSLAFFYDYGRVWRAPRTGLPRDISSAGVELIWDLSVLYDVPLRIRTGLAVPRQDGSRTKRGNVGFDIAFGSDF